MKTALITGVGGQIGSYLAEFLLAKGYLVHGMIRRTSGFNTTRIDHLRKEPQEASNFQLHYGDVCDLGSLITLIEKTEPQEIYNLAAQSHVRVSFDVPERTLHDTGLSTFHVLEATHRAAPTARFYQASSSEMFGASPPPQNEDTAFHPRSPYGCAKVLGFHLARHYREALGMYIVNGICFNTESPRRSETFVTRKITRAVGRIAMGLQDHLYLGNLNAQRDWMYAPETVDAIWRSLQAETPNDYVFGTGVTHSIRDFLDLSFGRIQTDWQWRVRTDPRYYRPTEVDVLRADPSRAKAVLGWEAQTDLATLVTLMVDHDLQLAQNELEGTNQRSA